MFIYLCISQKLWTIDSDSGLVSLIKNINIYNKNIFFYMFHTFQRI